MEKFNGNGFIGVVTNDKVKLEISIANLVNAFNCCPDNFDGSKVRRGMRQEFARHLVERLFDETDQDTGASYIEEAFDKVFYEMMEDDLDFIKHPDDED